MAFAMHTHNFHLIQLITMNIMHVHTNIHISLCLPVLNLACLNIYFFFSLTVALLPRYCAALVPLSRAYPIAPLLLRSANAPPPASPHNYQISLRAGKLSACECDSHDENVKGCEYVCPCEAPVLLRSANAPPPASPHSCQISLRAGIIIIGMRAW